MAIKFDELLEALDPSLDEFEEDLNSMWIIIPTERRYDNLTTSDYDEFINKYGTFNSRQECWNKIDELAPDRWDAFIPMRIEGINESLNESMTKEELNAKAFILQYLNRNEYSKIASLLNNFDFKLTEDPDTTGYVDLNTKHIVLNRNLSMDDAIKSILDTLREKSFKQALRDPKFIQQIKDQNKEFEKLLREKEKNESLNESLKDKNSFIDWLSEHEQAYEDACNYFRTDNLSLVDAEKLEDWLYDHQQLAKDYSNHFNASLNEATDKEKYKITYEPYERYTTSGVKTATFTAPNLFEALCKICDNLLLYFNREDIEEEGYTVEDILNRLHSENGDGCDFILSIENISTGKIIFDDSEAYSTDDDWDLDESLKLTESNSKVIQISFDVLYDPDNEEDVANKVLYDFERELEDLYRVKVVGSSAEDISSIYSDSEYFEAAGILRISFDIMCDNSTNLDFEQLVEDLEWELENAYDINIIGTSDVENITDIYIDQYASDFPELTEDLKDDSILGPYSKYYNFIGIQGWGDYIHDILSVVEDNYGMEFLGVAEAKDEYYDRLMDDGNGAALVVKDPGSSDIQLVAWIDDRLYPIELQELRDILEESLNESKELPIRKLLNDNDIMSMLNKDPQGAIRKSLELVANSSDISEKDKLNFKKAVGTGVFNKKLSALTTYFYDVNKVGK